MTWDDFDAALFDLDGVLTPTADVHMRAWAQMFGEFLAGHPDQAPYTDRDYFDHVDGRPRYEGVAGFLGSRGLELPEGDPSDAPDARTVCGLGNRKNALFIEVLERDGVTPYPGSMQLLDHLELIGVSMAVVSSSKNAADVLRVAGIADRFPVVVDGVVATAQGLAGKPEPATYTYAAEQLGLASARCVVLEDALSGVQAGAAGDFGLVVGVDRGTGADQLTAHGAQVVVADLAELIEMAHKYPSPHVPPPAVDPLDRSRFPPEEWRLVERAYSKQDLGTTETLFAVSNGYLGLRGNPEEGRDSHTHGSYINGFHETWPIRHAEDAFGLARVGQTTVNVPDPKVLKIYVEDEPLLLDIADLEHYERSLDFRDGLLRRELVWCTSAGKRVRVSTTRMVSADARHLAVMTMDIEMLEGDAPVTVSSQLLNRQDGSDEYHVISAAMGEGFDPRKAEGFERRVLEPQVYTVEDDRLLLGYRTHDSRMTLAVAVEHRVETDNTYTQNQSVDRDVAKQVMHFEATQGRPIRIEKIAAYHTSRGVPVRELADRCRRTLDRSVAAGVPRLHAEHRAKIEEFWAASDVQVGSQPAVQQAVRWNLFQLLQASARAGSHGIPAKGMTGSGYGGHYFWDTECYVLPFLVYTNPQAARNALRFRHNMLEASRDRAAELAQQGALFPWRTINGQEASAYFAAGTAQYHINADVAQALIKYVRATGDRGFLLREGVDILVETARLWADLGFWRGNGTATFHIHGVTGPDEYTTVVNDNLFTNVMARSNLKVAAEAVGELRQTDPRDYARAVARLRLRDEEIEEWRRAADAMFIPFDQEVGVHPQDLHFLEREMWDLEHTPNDKRPLLLHYHPLVIYRFQVLKQADVVLAMYLAGDRFTAEQKRANFEYYDPITTGDSTLSAVVQSIVAAEVGYHQLALRYFYAGLFVDLDDRHGNTTDGTHIASTGGVWSALTGGFGGMRDYEGQLTFDPRLPRTWESLTWRMVWKGSRLQVTVTTDAICFEVCSGDPVTLSVRGQEVEVGTRGVRVALDHQGPALQGLLERPLHLGDRRPDGSVITATVPRPSELPDHPELVEES